ncbi:MAG: hypothetical protein MUF20_00260 [Methylotetracoccus sp.]|nr:hypothetical protein [Methylotetracoccus sp.]
MKNLLNSRLRDFLAGSEAIKPPAAAIGVTGRHLIFQRFQGPGGGA